MLYLIALFLHVVGALMLAAAVAIEWMCVAGLRKASGLERAKESLSTYSKLNMIGGIGMILILVPGIYMMAVVWHNAPWIVIGFVDLVLIGGIGGIITGKKMRKMDKEAGSLGNLTPEFRKLMLDNSLVLSIRLRTMLLLGVVYMMTVRPLMTGSIVVLSISIVLGFIPVGPRVGLEKS